MVISALGIINLITSPEFPWFLFPALGWGIGLGIHFWNVLMSFTAQEMSRRWRGFFHHLGPYLVVIGALAMINLIASPEFFWFLFPAVAWGVGLGIHFWNVLLSSDQQEEERKTGKKRSGTVQEQKHRQTHHEARQVQREARHARLRVEETNRQPEIVEKPPVTGQSHISSKAIRMHLDKAQAYKEQIHNIIQATPDEEVNHRLRDLATQVDEWAQAIEDLAVRVDKFQQNTLIHHDLESVPEYIEDLESRLQDETNPGTRVELERTLNNRRSQLASLQQLENTMKRAEIQIESTLSALGTIYSQILTGQSTNHVADYSRLSEDVDEEVQSLQDQLEALEEIKLGRM
jgi:hypothetical protein